MPTYEYVCDGCGHRFDEFQSFKDDPLKVCPTCKEEKLRRLFGTGAAILFKGSGFYETDYRSDSYKQAAKAEKDATSKSNGTASSDSAGSKSTDSAKTESKPSSSTT
jgi:putative FmdB family regulatory protein